MADTVGNSVGAVEAIAADLSPDTATAIIQAADASFVDAISIGFIVAAGFVLAALVAVFAFIPRQMRAQAELADEEGDQPSGERTTATPEEAASVPAKQAASAS